MQAGDKGDTSRPSLRTRESRTSGNGTRGAVVPHSIRCGKITEAINLADGSKADIETASGG